MAEKVDEKLIEQRTSRKFHYYMFEQDIFHEMCVALSLFVHSYIHQRVCNKPLLGYTGKG